MTAAATYTVAREETRTVLAVLSQALGTKYTVPDWSNL